MTAPRIVLLSDDPAALAAIHRLLAEEGYRTLRCRPRDVADLHALVRRARPALVVLDLRLAARADGRALLRRLCADLATAQIPAVIAAGRPAPPGLRARWGARACRSLAAPCDSNELLAMVEGALGPSPAARSFDAYVHATLRTAPPFAPVPGGPPPLSDAIKE
jgi:CheY-like chemotaxis protein